MKYTKKDGELSLLAHHMNAFYELKYDSAEKKTVIEVYGDKASDDWSTGYEVVSLCPVNTDKEHYHLDCLAVLDDEFNIVAYSESADWVYAFIDGNDNDGFMEILEQRFAAIIRQLHTGIVDHVGQ